MEEPMEKLVEHAVLPLVRITSVNEAGTYSAPSSETSGLTGGDIFDKFTF
jgi:hypothetical protein